MHPWRLPMGRRRTAIPIPPTDGAPAERVRLLPCLILAAVLAAGSAPARAQDGSDAGEWHSWGGNAQFTRYSPLDRIAPHNVTDLEVAWRWQTADRELQESNPLWRAGRNEDTPLMANGVLYTVTGLGLIAALDPATGETRWVHDPRSYEQGRWGAVGFIQRGLAYWTDGTEERVLVGTIDAHLVSLDARTGQPDEAFGDGGRVDLLVGVPRTSRDARHVAARRPLVAGDVVVIGSSISDRPANREMPPGSVHAYDVRSGRRLWTFYTVPREFEAGYETWLNGSAEYSGNANVWAGMAYDPELDYVYLPTSTPTNDYYGGQRPGDNLFAESLVCLEARTGRRVWHFQAVHHGLWDYDFASTPVLADITVDGRPIKAVIQASKQAFAYVFDRATGEPVWPIEERPVPESTVPGEWTAPTQPFPTRPAPFDLQGATEENLIDFTPELRQRALAQLGQFDHGPLFTPPSLRGTLILPGIVGGANWPGGAFDTETGLFYVASRMNPSLIVVSPVDAARSNLQYRGQAGGPGQGGVGGVPDAASRMTVDGLPLFKPPYFRVTALDMSTGDERWTAPLGNGPLDHPLLRDLDLGPLGGDYHRGSVLVTKGLLFVSMSAMHSQGVPQRAAWSEWADPDDELNLLYAFDKLSGELLHTIQLDGFSAAAPMTYAHEGRQYLVVATGSGPDSAVVALGLPEEE